MSFAYCVIEKRGQANADAAYEKKENGQKENRKNKTEVECKLKERKEQVSSHKTYNQKEKKMQTLLTTNYTYSNDGIESKWISIQRQVQRQVQTAMDVKWKWKKCANITSQQE